MRNKPGSSVVGIFRQLVAQGRIKFNLGVIAIEPKEDDLTRIHNIIHEIDDRRVFYQAFDDERPEYMVTSVRSAREAIHAERKGIWADAWAREMVQKILHDLGDFITIAEKLGPPKNHHESKFEEFENAAAEMRLCIWSAVAELVIAFGDEVKPWHLPPDLLELVRSEREQA